MEDAIALTDDFGVDGGFVGEDFSVSDVDITDEDIREFNSKRKLVFKRHWKSLGRHIALFPVMVLIAYQLSFNVPETISAIGIGLSSHELVFSIPASLLFPFLVIFHGWWKINDRYVEIDKNVLFLHKGCLSLRKQTVEMETETLLVVQCSQTAWERIMGLGTVSVGRFSRRALELDMPGIKHPHRIVKKLKKRIVLARKVKAKKGS